MDESTVSADTIEDFKDLSTHDLNSRENRVLVVLYLFIYLFIYFLNSGLFMIVCALPICSR